ncbi:RNA-guided endonuclease IscB [Streptomyces abikoensis]|uniref:RNA-guided endonuclease IscB n=1 Tax=Streptomyces abikoensis TaxID=97398 RepID=A0ABW7T6F1_9ACTN
MATFHAGQRTDRAVLPQQPALEFASADTPENRDETGRERLTTRRRAASGVEHVRGETLSGALTTGRVTPDRPVREAGRKAQPAVFVLDKHGAPLQPTTPARARKLLKQGRAAVHRHTPFVIRMKDRTVTQSSVHGVELGIDPGSQYTGFAVFATTRTEAGATRRGLYAIELAHRGNQIRDKLARRAAYRRGRRTRNLRYRTPRFLNRRRPKGWLAPSLKHRLDTVLSWANRLARWAPISKVHIENTSFDTHALSVGRPLESTDYQKGSLYYCEAREYLSVKWGRACAYCGVRAVRLNIDHIHPRSRGGADRVSNLVLCCAPCNQAKSNRPVEEFLAHNPPALRRVLSQVKAPLRDAAAVNATRWAIQQTLATAFPVVCSASGGRTKWNRQRLGLPKTHTLDALCVGSLDELSQYPAVFLSVTATGRGTYARTSADKYGFPRLYRPRTKLVHGYATGDLAQAVVPSGKKAGTHVGRISVRTRGNFNIRTSQGLLQGIRHTYFHLLQRADGYGYTARPEGAPSSPPEAARTDQRRLR